MDNLFRHLHQQAAPLCLPNAWDAGSACLIADLGAQAIATTSAGVAWSLGYRDGDVLPLDEHLACIKRIQRVIDVPLSVDMEGGYSANPITVGDTVARFMDAGAVGINLQDASAPPELLCEKIIAARAAAARAGIDLYINIRTDVFARQLVAAEQRVEETLKRAQAYRNAGADGIFVLGAVTMDEIRRIASGTELLLNVIAWPGLPPVPELAALGVRRVSAGSWLPQTLWAQTATLVQDFLEHGMSAPLVEQAAAYGNINVLMPE